MAWFYHTAVAMLMGVRGEFDGLRLDPQLPGKWKRAKVCRKFRGAEYDIEIKRSRRVKRVEVVLDGKELPGNLVPIQPAGTKHKVTVTVPG